MAEPIIKVHKLGKKYRIGAKINPEGLDNFRDVILNTVKAPFRNLKRLRKLTNFEDGGDGEASDIIWALKDVSFEVNKGEVVGIIGRNGSGKSTLLKILSRITEPTKGCVELRGRVASLLEVGTGFHRELTGRENIYLNGSILGMKKWEINKKFDEIVAFSEIEKFIDTPVKHYSSGMYVRLAFAVAAYLEPEILLVDEVLAVGDVAFQKKCLGKMNDVAKAGRTVLFVSHNMGAISELCETGLLLEGGKVIENGAVKGIIQSYLGGKSAGPIEIVIPESKHSTRFGGTSSISLEHVALIDGFGDRFAVRWKEPIELLLTVKVSRYLTKIHFGLAIHSIQGIRIFNTPHNECKEELLSFDPGVYEIKIKLENYLQPGNYFIEITASIGSGIIFNVPEVVILEVLPIKMESEKHFPNGGLINSSSSWEFSKK